MPGNGTPPNYTAGSPSLFWTILHGVTLLCTRTGGYWNGRPIRPGEDVEGGPRLIASGGSAASLAASRTTMAATYLFSVRRHTTLQYAA